MSSNSVFKKISAEEKAEFKEKFTEVSKKFSVY